MIKIIAKENLKFVVFVLILVGLLVLSHFLGLHEKISKEEIQSFISGLGLFGPFAYILIYVLTSLIMFPASVLSIASGAIWGAYLGTLYTVIAAVIASILPFYIARGLGRKFSEKMFKKSHSSEICDRFIGKQGFVIVFIMRLLPFVPWDAVNYASGLCSIRFRDYIVATLIGTIPASFIYNMIGSSFGEPIDKSKIAVVIAMVTLIAMTTITYKWLQKRKGRKV